MILFVPGYYRVNYNIENWRAIIDQLNSENFHSIHELNRAQLLDDSFNLARRDYLDFSIALDLLKYLGQETSLVPLFAGLRSIEFLLSTLDEEKFFNDLKTILLKIVDETYSKVNNKLLVVAPEDQDYHILTKLHVNSFACKVGARSCTNDVMLKMLHFDYEHKQFDVNERPWLLCGVLDGDLSSLNWTQMKLRITRTNGNENLYRDNQDEISEIFEAFSTCDKNLARVERLLNDIFFYDNETFSYEHVSDENALQVVRNLIRTSSSHRGLMMQFYSANFDAVNEK